MPLSHSLSPLPLPLLRLENGAKMPLLSCFWDMWSLSPSLAQCSGVSVRNTAGRRRREKRMLYDVIINSHTDICRIAYLLQNKLCQCNGNEPPSGCQENERCMHDREALS